jgi:histidinol-phosphate aminotransferase
MANIFQSRVPAHIQALQAYDPGYEPSEIKRRLGLARVIELGSNENSLGPAPAAIAFLSAPNSVAFRYPDAGGSVLKAALSALYALPTQHFTLGNGTHELLTLIAETFCVPGDEVLHAQYGFAVYRLAALGAGATPVAAAADENLRVSPQALLRAITARTKLVYLANPNNPTGALWTKAELAEFLQALPSHVIFVLDEAYVEFVDEDLRSDSLPLLSKYSNIVLARTFSKAYGLASLRVGYTIAHPDFANMLERTRLSFNVNSIAMQAACLALADQAHIHFIQRENAARRAELHAALTALGLQVLPSQGNFLLVDFGRDAAPIERALVQHGVIVRPMRGYGLPNHLRITVGKSDENAAFLGALVAVLSP